MSKASDLIEKARIELFDEIIGADDEDELWSNQTLLRYVNEAQKEFARLTLCLPGKVDQELEILERRYPYDSKIILPYGGHLSVAKKRIWPESIANFERRWMMKHEFIEAFGNWEDDVGIPKFFITDIEAGYFYLWPTPVRAETLTLYSWVYPSELVNYTDDLEIPEQYEDGLLFKIKSLALAKLDADSGNLEQSMLFGQKWVSFVQDARATFDQRFNRGRTAVS